MSVKSKLRSGRENVNAAYVNVGSSPREAVRRLDLAIAYFTEARAALATECDPTDPHPGSDDAGTGAGKPPADEGCSGGRAQLTGGDIPPASVDSGAEQGSDEQGER